MPRPELPVPQVMVLCDHATTDPSTGKNYILGEFSGIFAAKFPAKHPHLCVFLSVTDGRATTPFLLKLVLLGNDALHERELLKIPFVLEFPDPLTTVSQPIMIQGVVFPRAGEYRFILECDGTPLIERRLVVRELPGGES